MSQNGTRTESEWTGQVSETPILAILRRIFLEELTGTLVVSRGDELRSFFFEKGQLRTARSSQDEHRTGPFLKKWGNITEERLDWALNVQKETGAPLHRILVENGILTKAVLDAEAKRLMEMIVHSTLTWSDGIFHFQPTLEQAFNPDVIFTLSTLAVMIEGIRRVPESEKFLELIGDFSKIPVITRNPDRYRSLPLPSDVVHFLWLIDGNAPVSALLDLVPFPRESAAKVLYALVYCGLVEIRDKEDQTPRERFDRRAPVDRTPESVPEKPSVPTPASSPQRERRKLVIDTYLRIEWISHYDLLGVSTRATTKQIKVAYRDRSQLFRVDSATEELADCQQQLAALSSRLKLAYEVLINSASRTTYDTMVREGERLILQATAATGTSQGEAPSSSEIRRRLAAQNYERARRLIENNDFSSAILMLEETVRFVPESAEYHHALGLAQLKMRGTSARAIENLRTAARLEPSRHALLGTLAKVLYEQGALEDAKFYAERAVQFAPEKAEYQKIREQIEEAMEKPKGLLDRLSFPKRRK